MPLCFLQVWQWVNRFAGHGAGWANMANFKHILTHDITIYVYMYKTHNSIGASL